MVRRTFPKPPTSGESEDLGRDTQDTTQERGFRLRQRMPFFLWLNRHRAARWLRLFSLASTPPCPSLSHVVRRSCFLPHLRSRTELLGAAARAAAAAEASTPLAHQASSSPPGPAFRRSELQRTRLLGRSLRGLLLGPPAVLPPKSPTMKLWALSWAGEGGL